MTDKTDSPQPVAEISHGRLLWAIPTPDYVLSQRYMNNDTHPLYTADHIAAAVAAERERCIQACISGGELAEQIYGTGCECVMTAELCADKIREGELPRYSSASASPA